MDEQDERILNILGVENEEDAEVIIENQERYLHYLDETIEMPCILTGIEDFNWEEYDVLGSGSEKEYEELKKKYPSNTESMNFLVLMMILMKTEVY